MNTSIYRCSYRSILIVIISAVFALNTSVAGGVLTGKPAAADTSLILNGEGFRTAYGMKMYFCGLYLSNKSSDPAGIINSDSPMEVKMVINSSLVTGKRLEKSTREGFMNSSGGDIGQLTSRIDSFLSMVVSDLKKGDEFHFIYYPQKGTEIIKNGVSKGVINGIDFKKALFGIWLCDKPPTEELKRRLLGK